MKVKVKLCILTEYADIGNEITELAEHNIDISLAKKGQEIDWDTMSEEVKKKWKIKKLLAKAMTEALGASISST